MKLYHIVLYVLFICSPLHASRNCFPSTDCGSSISDDCDDISRDFIDGPCDISTFFKPRSITSDLTYRNSMTFYQRFRGAASHEFITFDSTFLYQKNRRALRIGRGFFGTNPILVAEHGAPINSLNLDLESKQPEGFCSVVRISPKRSVIAWLPQIIFNFDCYCYGLWSDIAFAVVRADHSLCLFEQVGTPGDTNDKKTVQEALDKLNTFPFDRRHTGVDDIELRTGYTLTYCDDDIVSFYLVGSIPTGKRFNNARWFQPIVGTRAGGIGAGLMLDSTLWYSEFSESECLFVTELKYLHSFSYTDKRIFDLTNGPLSRFLRVAPENDRNNPRSATTLLQACVTVEPTDLVQWWAGLHFQWCNWGWELGYNLWYRTDECIKKSCFDFENFGIFDMTRSTDLTSHSNARISDGFGVGTPDATFVELTSKDVSNRSATARKALSHTFSTVFTYDSLWCDVPFSLCFGARYELAGHKRHTSTLENWGIYGKLSISY